MKKNILKIGLVVLLCPALFFCQEKSSNSKPISGQSPTQKERAKLPKPYQPKDDAELKIKELIVQAQKENKNIILQAGGNWCIWCLRFNDYLNSTPELKQLLDENYLYYHLNYSPENKNEKVFERYGHPGKTHGYPVFIVLDKNGKHIHTQESGSLEQNKSYNLDKVKAFLETWKPALP